MAEWETPQFEPKKKDIFSIPSDSSSTDILAAFLRIDPEKIASRIQEKAEKLYWEGITVETRDGAVIISNGDSLVARIPLREANNINDLHSYLQDNNWNIPEINRDRDGTTLEDDLSEFYV